MKIILLGYMGSGKSSVGKLLATQQKLPFIDLDTYIELHEEKKITNIFKEDGEIYFRIKENEYLKELLLKKDSFVLSLGGGTPCYANNMDVILKDEKSIAIYLDTSITTLTNRLKNRKKRPLVANLSDEELTEFIAKHLFERRPFYQKADIIIKTTHKSINEIVKECSITLNKQ